jgi:hypothetical protein
MQGYEKIAFSYGADWYCDEFPHPNPLVGKMMGRIMTISKMYKSGLIGASRQSTFVRMCIASRIWLLC